MYTVEHRYDHDTRIDPRLGLLALSLDRTEKRRGSMYDQSPVDTFILRRHRVVICHRLAYTYTLCSC